MRIPFSRRKFIASAAAAMVPPALAHAKQGAAGLLSMLSAAPQPSERTSHSQAWQDAGVLDLSNSPFAKLKIRPRPRRHHPGWFLVAAPQNQSRLQHPHHARPACSPTAAWTTSSASTGKSSAPQKGPVYSDSDIYKWTEAVGFALQTPDPNAPSSSCAKPPPP